MNLETVLYTPCASPREFEGYSLKQSVDADDLQPIVRALPFGPDTDSIPPIRGIARARYPHRSEWREAKKAKARARKRRSLMVVGLNLADTRAERLEHRLAARDLARLRSKVYRTIKRILDLRAAGEDTDESSAILESTRSAIPLAKERVRRAKENLGKVRLCPTIRHSKTGEIVALNHEHARRYAHAVVRRQIEWAGIQPAWSPDRISDLAEDCCHEALARWLSGESRASSPLRAIASVIRMRVRAITGEASRHRQSLSVEHASISAVGTDALRAALIRGLTSGARITDAARMWGESLATGEALPGKATRCPKGVMAELLALAKTAE